MGPKIDELLQAKQVSTKEHGKVLKRILILEDGRVPAKEARNWKIEGQNRSITRKEYRRFWNEFEIWRFSWHRKVYGISHERKCCWAEVQCQRKKETLSESRRPCMKRSS